MGKYYELTNETFGNWRVLYRNGSTPNKAAVWRCECTLCQREYDVVGASLRNGSSTMCVSCSAKQNHLKPYSYDKIKIVFRGMKGRCYNPNHRSYPHYGAKGITIYDEWLENPPAFYEWAYANGYAPGMSIERRDNSKPYSPENCKFIPRTGQSSNRSNSMSITIEGKTKCLAEWCRDYGINENVVRSRISRGKWEPLAALTTPPRKRSQ